MRGRRIRQWRIAAFLLAVWLLLLPAAGCQKKQLKDNQTAFAEAITAGNYPLAADIYREASMREGFDPEAFAEPVRRASERVVAEFKQGKIDFDKADLALRALSFSPELNELLASDFEAAKASISPGENIEEALKQARLFAEAGDYQSSLMRYDEILAAYPEHAEARSQRSTMLGEYVDSVDKRSRELAKQGFPRSAIFIVERALAYDPDNQVLLARKAELEKKVSEQAAKIKEEIPKYELGLLLKKGDLAGAQKYIDKVKDRVKDVEPLQMMLNEEIDRYVQALIDRAASEAAEDIQGRWSAPPYGRAIATLNEGLALYPDNSALKEAKEGYQAKTPVNVCADIEKIRGNITEGGTGTNAAGYSYSAEAYDRAVLTKPDMSFSYNTQSYPKTRLIISPKSSDTSVYANMELIITIGGKTVYSDVPFSSSLNTLDLSYDLEGSPDVQITLRQSGFASFFEGIFGRNLVFFEMYLVP